MFTVLECLHYSTAKQQVKAAQQPDSIAADSVDDITVIALLWTCYATHQTQLILDISLDQLGFRSGLGYFYN